MLARNLAVRIGGKMRLLRAAIAVVAALALLLGAATLASAQDDPSGTSYITPFPEGDIYKLQAYGDVFAEGLLNGLTESLAAETRVQIPRRHRAIQGLTRLDFEEEIKSEEASRDPVHIAVVMLGIYDRNHIRVGPGSRERMILASEEWREEYGRRVDRLIKTLKRRGAAIYWVGLPLMRRYEVNDPVQLMNDIVRERAHLNGIKYIDITAHFADEAGNYSAYGPDVSGRQRLLREADGVLFTWAGNRKLAHFVEQEIKRDLTQAKNDRSIPLAGTEAEQKRISALKPKPAAPDGAWKGTVNASKDGKSSVKAGPPGTPETLGEQKADNGRITLRSVGASGREELVTVDIVRPAIPAAVVALVTRKETGDKASQVGDVIADDIGGGLVVLSSITPSGLGSSGVARSIAPSQTPFYQVLIKGERPPPKAGRADDFTWPPPEPDIAVEPVPARARPSPSRISK